METQIMTPKYAGYKEHITEKLKNQHFMHLIGFELSEITPGYVTGGLEITESLKQQFGFVHGGVTATVCDLVMGFAAYTLVGEKQGVVTSDLKIAYLRPGLGKRLEGKGRVIKAGNLLYYCEADIISIDNGVETLIARGYSTMCTVEAPK